MSLAHTGVLVSLMRQRVLPVTTLSATHQYAAQAKDVTANSILSRFVSRGLASQNIKHESVESNMTKNILEPEKIKEEFTKITRKEAKIVLYETPSTSTANTHNPIVLLFGWGGASHKNLSKYSTIYLGAGFTAVQYILPTRHIFRDTAQIPELMGNLLMQLDKLDIYDRPVYVHCLSDTGVMCYQGMDVAIKESSKMKRLNIRGVVWDSCCGPRPEVTLSRVIALLLVNWMCCLRDRLGMMQSINISYRLLLDRGWPSLIRKWRGQPVELSLIAGTWSGDFGRDHYHNFPSIPELFLYSNRDFYLPQAYLEREVLKSRKQVGADFTAVKFKGSPHVAHLRYFKEDYRKEVLSFINVRQNVKSVRDNSDVEIHEKNGKNHLEHPLQPKFIC